MTDRPNWGWGDRPPVPMFTESEIRAVMETHYPEAVNYGDGDVVVQCSCSGAWVPRDRCLGCRVRVNQDDPDATKHRKDCRWQGPSSIGVTMHRDFDFDVDHLIEKLKEHRERTLAVQPCTHAVDPAAASTAPRD